MAENYQLREDGQWLTRASDGAQVPVTSSEVVVWIAAGNTPLQPVPAQAKTSACSAIDAQAGLTRKKYITDVAGQDATYQSKAADAAAYKAAGYPSASIANYPWVQAEAKAISGATPTATQYQSAADYILTTQAQWAVLGASIEQARRAGKNAVTAAGTISSVQSAQAAAIAALQAL